MLCNRLSISTPFTYNSTGKFTSPSPEWIHDKRFVDNFELIIMTSGVLYMEIDMKKYAVHPGQYLLIQPGNSARGTIYTSIKGYKPSNCSYYWLHFSCVSHSLYEPIPTDFIPTDHYVYLPMISTLTNSSIVLQYLRQLQDCVRAPYKNYIDYANYLSTIIISEIYRQFLDSYQTLMEDNNISGKNNLAQDKNKSTQLYNDMIDYINASLQQNITVQMVAEHFGYSAKYLSALCKRKTTSSLKQYIQEKQIEQANYLLLDTNMTITQISLELGFTNCNNFSRLYKNNTGMSPNQYRGLYSKRINN